MWNFGTGVLVQATNKWLWYTRQMKRYKSHICYRWKHLYIVYVWCACSPKRPRLKVSFNSLIRKSSKCFCGQLWDIKENSRPYIETETERDIQTDRQTDRQRPIPRDRQTKRQTHRQIHRWVALTDFGSPPPPAPTPTPQLRQRFLRESRPFGLSHTVDRPRETGRPTNLKTTLQSCPLYKEARTQNGPSKEPRTVAEKL